MNIAHTVLGKLGFVPAQEVSELRKEVADIKAKSGNWDKLFSIGQEYKLFGEKVTQPYSQIASVYKAVKAISDNVSQADLIFRDKKSKKKIDDDEIVELFRRPNPLMSETDFIQAWVGFAALYGESMVIKEQSVGQMVGTKKLPAELWAFNPLDFKHETDNGRNVLGWRYTKEGRIFRPEEVMFMRDFNPHCMFRGLSPMAPIEKIIDIDWQTLVFNKAFFENDAHPGLMLGTDKQLNDEIIKRLKTQLEDRHKGASNAHKVAIFEAGLKPFNENPSHKEMEFIEQKRFAREEIYGIWKVPKAMFSVTDDLNYATFIGQMKMFWDYSLMPILKKVEGAINVGIVNGYNNKIEAAFDLSNVVAYREGFKDKVETAKTLISIGVPLNEVNEKLELGFKKQPWGDTFWIPFGQVPADPKMAEQYNEIQSTPAGESPAGKSFDELRRQAFWNTFLTKQAPIESRMAKTIKTHFFDQRKDALEALNTLGAEGFKIDWQAQDEALKARIKQHVYSCIKEGVGFAKDVLNQKNATFSNEDAKVSSYLVQRMDKITRINRTVQDQLKVTLAEGTATGETIQQLSDRIRDVYNMASSRSLMIARTETTGAVNGGSNIYYEEAGVQKKEWLTARDEHVRDSHKKLEGEVVGINDDFSNGLSCPGDMKGDGEDNINCRCTLLPVMK
jgi:HK97 family phage portal protein